MLSTRLIAVAGVLLLCAPALGFASPSALVEVALSVTDPDPTPHFGDVAISPSGDHVYIAADGIYVYDRDVTGELTFVERVGEARYVVLSPDGLFAYGIDFGPATAIHVYSRDVVTGALTLVESEPTLFGAGSLAINGNGTFVFHLAGTHVVAYARSSVTGELTLGVDNLLSSGTQVARSMAASSDGFFLYRIQTNGLRSFSVNPATGALANVDFESMSSPRHIAISSDDASLYVLRTTELRVYDLDGGGNFTLVQSFPLLHSSAFTVNVSPAGDHVYVGSGEVLTAYDRDAGTGLLTFDADFSTRVASAEHTMAPDGENLYAPSPVTVVGRDLGTGALSYVDSYMTMRWAEGGALSPDDAHMYLRFDGVDWMMVTERDGVTGALTPVQTLRNGLDGVEGLDDIHDVTVSPDGAHVYALSNAEHAVLVFARDAGPGLLTFVGIHRNGEGGIVGLGLPDSIVVSPDGSHVYGLGSHIVVFERDPGTGSLAFVESHAVSSVGPIALCPDGGHLYVDRRLVVAPDLIEAWERDATTGALTFLASYDGLSLGGAEVEDVTGIACSPDGQFLHVLSSSPALHTFRRDPSTGVLTAVSVHDDESFGFESLGGEGLGLSPDGEYAYIVDPLTVLRRTPATGAVAFVQVEPSSVDGREVVVSSDGRDVYVLTDSSEAGVLNRHTGFTCADTPVAGCSVVDIGKLVLREGILDFKDKMTLLLKGGPATTLADFDPGIGNHFAACLYDESGPATLVGGGLAVAYADCRKEASHPAKSCWKVTTSSKLNDKNETPDGLRRLTLKPGAIGRTKIIARGQGIHFREPPLPLGLPVRAQIQSANGPCWEATFATATKNDTAQFKAKVKP